MDCMTVTAWPEIHDKSVKIYGVSLQKVVSVRISLFYHP